MPHPVRIVKYDPAWPGRYEHEASRILEALGPVAVRVEHVGSTAVDIRARYAAEKRRAAALHPEDSIAYTDAKTPWIRAEERRLGIIGP